MHAISRDLDKVEDFLVEGGVRYLRENPAIEKLVLGVSGGVDSALTAYLARKILNKMNGDGDSGYRLIGYSLPILTNKEDELLRARAVGEAYCNNFAEVSLDSAFRGMVPGIDNALYQEFLNHNLHGDDISLASKIRLGNIKARLRMMFLYDKANKYNGMVLSTDNYTELLLGFWTLHGDVGDFGLIQNLWKTEVYALADHIGQRSNQGALLSCVDAIATDGLGVSESDLVQLLPGKDYGSSRDGYEQIDDILENWLLAEDREDIETAEFQKFNDDHPVIERMLRTEFKRRNPVNLTRAQTGLSRFSFNGEEL